MSLLAAQGVMSASQDADNISLVSRHFFLLLAGEAVVGQYPLAIGDPCFQRGFDKPAPDILVESPWCKCQ